MSKAHLPDATTIDMARSIAASLPAGDLHLSGVDTPLPAQAAAILREMLTSLAAGEPVALITASSELSPTEAAEFLNVSRGFVTKLMDDGTLPYHQVGSHRRIPGAAVAIYKATQQRQSKAAMDELVRLSQEMGGYDDQPPMPSKSDYRSQSGSSR